VRRNTCARPAVMLAAMLLSGVSAKSQANELTVRGELRNQTTTIFTEYLVELIDRTHRATPGRADVRSDGSFEFRGIQPGEYVLTVLNIQGDIVHEQLINLSITGGPLEIRIPERPRHHPGAKTVSVKQLMHPPTKKAYNFVVEAQRFSASGDYAHAAQALERAVRESPDYAEAHTNLGAQYVRTGRFEAAIRELNRAIEIAGPSVIALCNLASAQIRAGRRAEAIESARSALRMDSSAIQAHLILGAMLATDPQTKTEAIDHLELAAPEYESARQVLQRLRTR
jgi:tetratricopeptide (TPR) repeat protein